MESHCEGHCPICGNEMWSDEDYCELVIDGDEERVCPTCYDSNKKLKGKFTDSILIIEDPDYGTVNVGIDMCNCPYLTKKEAKEWATELFYKKAKDGFYDSWDKRKYRQAKVVEVTIW